MKKFGKIISLILAMLMICTAFASCKTPDKTPDTTPGGNTDTTPGGDEGIADKFFAQHPPAKEEAGAVEDGAGDGGGDGKPVFQQQCQAQNTALGHIGQGVDMVHAEGLENAAEKGHGAIGWFELWEHSDSFTVLRED